jgi:serine/threonine protein kinase
LAGNLPDGESYVNARLVDDVGSTSFEHRGPLGGAAQIAQRQETPMEKFCPKCGKGFGPQHDFCESDGEKLVMVNEEPSLIGRVLEGKYKLSDIVGQGGMGTVYLGYQSSMGRHVAVKVLKRKFAQEKVAIKRFLREARAASKLSHPNTITVYDFGQTEDGFLYMVMERLGGRPLSDILDEETRLTPARAVHIIGQICDSLSQAHARGIQHRDLKPENIFVEATAGNPDHVKVLDFGIAKMHEEEGSRATATGMVCGTPAYMSPEQAMGKDIAGSSDVYALGILLYELLSGQPPFDGDAAMEIMLKQLNEAPPEFPTEVEEDVPAALKKTLLHMLEKAPKDRPQTCQDVKSSLLDAIGVTGNRELQRSMEMSAQDSAPNKLGPTSSSSSVYTSFQRSARNARNQSTEVLRGLGKKRNVAIMAFVGTVLAAAVVWVAVAAQSGAASEASDVATRSGMNAAVSAAEVPTVVTQESVPFETALEASAPVKLTPVKEVKAERVSLTIQTIPSVAKVYDAVGAYLGETQLTVTPERDSGNFSVVLKRKGYHDANVTLSTKRDITQVRRMVPLNVTRKTTGNVPGTRERKTRPAPVPRERGIGTF